MHVNIVLSGTGNEQLKMQNKCQIVSEMKNTVPERFVVTSVVGLNICDSELCFTVTLRHSGWDKPPERLLKGQGPPDLPSMAQTILSAALLGIEYNCALIYCCNTLL